MTSPRKPLPLTRSSLDKKWEIKVSKDVKEYNLDDVLKHTLFDYVNDKDDPTSAANLATVSEQFYQLEKYQQAFADAIKTCLLHIAGYHYQVETISDKDDFFDL
ncbi:MAG TPA: hypothetical protein VHM20_03525, partial [Gammaproteobacteria bacterium]|nr:hypothetical protein [Gammaproteobacteria bacterium]